uniref:Odorant-binding protein 21 n=1 Tax=Cnaphalocrocis medinalis TaxID=437488 RepID=A0A0U3BYL7_CNAME|nr:odorant-binding protein 21 [Cnaphalocrocis medinalis]
MKCLKDHPVEVAELTNLQKLIVPKKMEVKCLLACAYKAEGMMTKDGKYDLEHAYKVAELTKNGDEKRLENGKKMSDLCSKVNEVEVSDGEKGCERAGLMFKCGVENAAKFGFKI